MKLRKLAPFIIWSLSSLVNYEYDIVVVKGKLQEGLVSHNLIN